MPAAETFLIVDDEPDTCWALQRILRKLGSCEIALNARDALFRAAQHNFSLVLLDAKLPDVDGLDLAVQLRSADPNVPILLVSGYFCRDDAAVREARAAGLIQAFVGKPFLHEDILGVVRQILHADALSGEAQRGSASDRQPSLTGEAPRRRERTESDRSDSSAEPAGKFLRVSAAPRRQSQT